mmetsp:Transcript_35972/g.99118  ORF Transcript_35972/g.99118 Transcript_35972/m.99118 type:complete len:394 (-) Transcript_35972:164-1345(-)
MGNQLPARCAANCDPTCCAVCVDLDAGRDPDEEHHNYHKTVLFRGARADASSATEEVTIDDLLTNEVAKEVELWRMDTSSAAILHGRAGLPDTSLQLPFENVRRSSGDTRVCVSHPFDHQADRAPRGRAEPFDSKSAFERELVMHDLTDIDDEEEESVDEVNALKQESTACSSNDAFHGACYRQQPLVRNAPSDDSSKDPRVEPSRSSGLPRSSGDPNPEVNVGVASRSGALADPDGANPSAVAEEHSGSEAAGPSTRPEMEDDKSSQTKKLPPADDRDEMEDETSSQTKNVTPTDERDESDWGSSSDLSTFQGFLEDPVEKLFAHEVTVPRRRSRARSDEESQSAAMSEDQDPKTPSVASRVVAADTTHLGAGLLLNRSRGNLGGVLHGDFS